MQILNFELDCLSYHGVPYFEEIVNNKIILELECTLELHIQRYRKIQENPKTYKANIIMKSLTVHWYTPPTPLASERPTVNIRIIPMRTYLPCSNNTRMILPIIERSSLKEALIKNARKSTRRCASKTCKTVETVLTILIVLSL